jgi:ELWxxDGT repeat protein
MVQGSYTLLHTLVVRACLGAAALTLAGCGSDSSNNNNEATPVESNAAPVLADNVMLSCDEDTKRSMRLPVSDPDGDALTITILSAPEQAGARIKDNMIELNPEPGYHGDGEIVLLISDGTYELRKSVPVSIISVNDAPEWQMNTDWQMTEDQAKILDLKVQDPDGDELAYKILSSPDWINAVIVDGQLRLTPAAHRYGNDKIVVQVSDGKLHQDIELNVSVAAQNDAPVIPAINKKTLTSGNAASFKLTASDPDGDQLTFKLLSAPSGFTVSVSATGTVTITPKAGYSGSGTVTVQVSDGKQVTRRSFTVAAQSASNGSGGGGNSGGGNNGGNGGGNHGGGNSNRAPSFAGTQSSIEFDEDASAKVDIKLSDADGDAVSWKIEPFKSNLLSVSGSQNQLSLVAAQNQFGSATIPLSASDGSATSHFNLTVTVKAVNDAPQLLNADKLGNSIFLTPGTQQTLALSVYDPDSADADISIRVDSVSNSAILDASVNQRDLQLNAKTLGSAVVSLTISDGEDSTDIDLTFEVKAPEKAYFVANDGVHGKELWVTDGTAEGTQMVQDLSPGADDSKFTHLYHHNDMLLLGAGSSTGYPSIAMVLADQNSIHFMVDAPWPADFIEYKDTVFFAHGGASIRKTRGVSGIYQTDGSYPGTQLIFSSYTTTPSPHLISSIHNLHIVGNKLLFFAITPEHGHELYMMDADNPSFDNVELVHDYAAGADDGFDFDSGVEIIDLSHYSNNGQTGIDATCFVAKAHQEREIFCIEFDASNTISRLNDQLQQDYADPENVLFWGKHMLFTAKVDGSNDRTAVWVDFSFGAKDRSPTGAEQTIASEKTHFIVHNNKALFTAKSQESGNWHWYSLDLSISDSDQAEKLPYLSDEESFHDIVNGQHWATGFNSRDEFGLLVDGLFTAPLSDILGTMFDIVGNQREQSVFSRQQINGKRLLILQTKDHGMEPWITDGTVAGTRMLKDIHAGLQSSLELSN